MSFKTALMAACAFLALGACADRETTTDQPGVSASAKGAPELGVFGVATADIDDAVAPGDDFFRYVNGKWLSTFRIPDEFPSYGSFTVLSERAEMQVRAIAESAANARSAPGSKEQKIGDYYNAFLDTDAINAKGLEPLTADLMAIAAITTHAELARAMGDPDLGLRSPFGISVDVDAKQPDRYIVYIGQGGLGMPNRNYYVDEKFADKRAAYRAYIAEMLGLAGVENVDEKAAAIADLENRIAIAHWSPEKRRNRDLTYNLKSAEELTTFAPGAEFAAMLEAAGLASQEEFVVREDDAISAIGRIFSETPVSVWRDYLVFHLLNSASDVLPAAFDEASFRFFGVNLRGTPKQRERWKRSVSAINGALGEAVGEVYVERHFPSDSKQKMNVLVVNLRRAMDERIRGLDWMGEETKLQALEKLEKFTPKIGYPDKWKDYSELKVIRGDAYGNLRRASAWRWRTNVAKLGGPIDRTEWGMNPQTVNAYYSPTRNEIVFPAAILQAPFFDPNADPAVNYGGIGAVIGHEIGHGFDDQGRKSDGDGVLRDWWTEEDAARFNALAERLGAQYASYEPIPGFPINPKLTMGENIGDIGGLAIAYYAYKLSLNGEAAPIINGFTGDQRFFLSWAQVWKRLVREEALKNQIATDSHSPAEFRVNGVVRNMDAWYEAFDVRETDALYLPVGERVQIW